MSLLRLPLIAGIWFAVALAASAAGAGDTAPGAAEGQTERGPVSARVRVEPTPLPIGDPVTLTIEITAEDGVELLLPVFGASLERFAILEFVPREHIDEAGRTISTQTYRLQAPSSGQHAIPPITVEFVDRRPGQRPAPEDEDAFELLTERLEFTVESVVPEDAGDDLKPPLGPLGALSVDDPPRWPWLGAGLALALAGIALSVVFWRLRARGKNRSAYEIALARLAELEARPRPGAEAMDSFFVEISDLVRRYLEDRFALHAPELTTEEFLEVASSSPDLTLDDRRFLQNFLGNADQVKFARLVPAEDEVETVLSAVRSFLQQTASDKTQAAAKSVYADEDPIRA